MSWHFIKSFIFFRGHFPIVNNADRQLYVNEIARQVGSGIGLADRYGVPGAYGSYNGLYNGYYGAQYGNYYGYDRPAYVPTH